MKRYVKANKYFPDIDAVLSDMGLDRETAHLHTGFRAAVNALGMQAWDELYDIWTKPWKKASLTKDEIKIVIAHGADVYKQATVRGTRFGSLFDGYKKVDPESISDTGFGSRSTHMGYGSQASVYIETVTLKQDQFGNLLIDESYEIWD